MAPEKPAEVRTERAHRQRRADPPQEEAPQEGQHEDKEPPQEEAPQEKQAQEEEPQQVEPQEGQHDDKSKGQHADTSEGQHDDKAEGQQKASVMKTFKSRLDPATDKLDDMHKGNPNYVYGWGPEEVKAYRKNPGTTNKRVHR